VSSILDSRTKLLEALETAKIRTATTGKLAAPAVLVEPGDPWSEPARLPGRLFRWQLTALGGSPDSEGSFAALGELLEAVDAALRAIPGAGGPTWARPADIKLGGVTYAASVGTVQIAGG
jgi:hypothetical protein